MWRKSDLYSVCGPEKAQRPEDAPIINSVWSWGEMRQSPGEKGGSFPGKWSIGMQSLFRLWHAQGDTKAFSTFGSKCSPCMSKKSISAGSVTSLGPPCRQSGCRKCFPGLSGLLPITEREIAGTWSGGLVWTGQMHMWVAGRARWLCSLEAMTCQVPK